MIAQTPPDCQTNDLGVRNCRENEERTKRKGSREMSSVFDNETTLRISNYIIQLF